MRDRINAFYYPDFVADLATLMRAILLFDEIHMMDRPSFQFGEGMGSFGLIGSNSPLRQVEQSFRDEGVPFYVHPAPSGHLPPEWYAEVAADVNDHEFLRRFQKGLETSETFRRIQIARGNYGAVGNHDDVARSAVGIDLSTIFDGYESPMALFEDPKVRHFDFSTPVSRAKNLVAEAVTCSTKLNFALRVGVANDLQPLADAKPYGDLLGRKYARATSGGASISPKMPLADLTFAIFDELMPLDRLKKITMRDAVGYRKASAGARDAFLEHMSSLHAKAEEIGADVDYETAINKIIVTEIRPAARDFQNSLQKIDDDMFGALGKGVLGVIGGSSLITVFTALSWAAILPAAGAGAVYVGKAAIDGLIARRAAERNCRLSYVLSLD